jgi:hypothetical protein
MGSRALPRSRLVVWLVAGVVGSLTAGTGRTARAYDFTIDLRTIGQGYQVRRFAADGSNEILSRRRLTQYLDLNVYDIEPARWRSDEGGRNILYFDASLRFDSDFGGYMLGRPGGADDIGELKQSQIDILYAFLGGKNVGGKVDFQLGRQFHFDLIDFYAFDGGDVVYHASRAVAVEGFAGMEVRGELPLSSPIYEIDGTSAGSRDPATRPGQNAALEPLVGGAVAFGGEGQPWGLRLAYRRVWSPTVDQLPGEPSSGVNEEKLGLTGSWAWRDRVYLMGGIRLNLLIAEFDDQQLALRVRTRARQWITFEYTFLAPSFDGDSIWNVFATGPYRDLRVSYEVGLSPEVKAYARAFIRLFELDPDVPAAGPYAGQDVNAAAPGGGLAWGGSLGATWRRGRGFLRGDGYAENGFGGQKYGADVASRFAIHPALGLEGRLTGFYWRSDLNPITDAGVVFGVQGGGRFQLGHGVRMHLLAEDNFGTMYTTQFRTLAVLEMDASI